MVSFKTTASLVVEATVGSSAFFFTSSTGGGARGGGEGDCVLLLVELQLLAEDPETAAEGTNSCLMPWLFAMLSLLSAAIAVAVAAECCGWSCDGAVIAA